MRHRHGMGDETSLGSKEKKRLLVYERVFFLNECCLLICHKIHRTCCIIWHAEASGSANTASSLGTLSGTLLRFSIGTQT